MKVTIDRRWGINNPLIAESKAKQSKAKQSKASYIYCVNGK
jgi:hypothetical protein